jgi:hypothetical protein
VGNVDHLKEREKRMTEFDAKTAHKVALESSNKEQVEEKNQTLRDIMYAAKKSEFSIITRPKFKTTIEHLKSLGYNVSMCEGYMSVMWGL